MWALAGTSVRAEKGLGFRVWGFEFLGFAVFGL